MPVSLSPPAGYSSVSNSACGASAAATVAPGRSALICLTIARSATASKPAPDTALAPVSKFNSSPTSDSTITVCAVALKSGVSARAAVPKATSNTNAAASFFIAMSFFGASIRCQPRQRESALTPSSKVLGPRAVPPEHARASRVGVAHRGAIHAHIDAATAHRPRLALCLRGVRPLVGHARRPRGRIGDRKHVAQADAERRYVVAAVLVVWLVLARSSF